MNILVNFVPVGAGEPIQGAVVAPTNLIDGPVTVGPNTSGVLTSQTVTATVGSDGNYHFTFDMSLLPASFTPALDIKTNNVVRTAIAVGIYKADLSDFTPQSLANLGVFYPTDVSPTYTTGQVTSTVALKTGVNYTLSFTAGGFRPFWEIPASIENVSLPIAS